MIDTGNTVFLEFHLLHPFSGENINCDDTGLNHKDIDIGDARRARISSQAFKRAMREWWRKHTSLPLGVRTSYISAEISKILADTADKEVVDELARTMIESLMCPMQPKDNDKTQSMLFVGSDETKRVADLARDNKALYDAATAVVKARKDLADAVAKAPSEPKAEEPKAAETPPAEPEKAEKKDRKGKKAAPKKAPTNEAVKEAQKVYDEAVDAMKRICIEAREDYQDGTDAIDILLFGRMLACKLDRVKGDKIERELPKKIQDDTLMQVAHAVSVNRLHQTPDFFVAVDDLHVEHGADAAAASNMLGQSNLSSNLYYRYLVLNVTGLDARLTDKALLRRAVESIMKAAMFAVPKGKQNSTATHTKPSFGFFVLRSGCPVSLVNTFERAITGVTDVAARRIDMEWANMTRLLGDDLGVIVSRVWSSAWASADEAKQTIPGLASSLATNFQDVVKDMADAIAPTTIDVSKIKAVTTRRELVGAGSSS